MDDNFRRRGFIGRGAANADFAWTVPDRPQNGGADEVTASQMSLAEIP